MALRPSQRKKLRKNPYAIGNRLKIVKRMKKGAM
jgi:hypothetical protein